MQPGALRVSGGSVRPSVCRSAPGAAQRSSHHARPGAAGAAAAAGPRAAGRAPGPAVSAALGSGGCDCLRAAASVLAGLAEGAAEQFRSSSSACLKVTLREALWVTGNLSR